MIRIAIADDHPIVRYGLKQLLDLEEDFEVVAEAADGRELLDRVQELDPDVLLLDLRMPNLDGLSTLQVLQQSNKRTKVIVLTESEDKNEFVQAMKLGCSGIVLKQTAPEVIVKSIRKVHSGEIWLDSHTTAAVMRQFAAPVESSCRTTSKSLERPLLSRREREIVHLVAQGLRNKEMAERIFISEQTVKNHMHNIAQHLPQVGPLGPPGVGALCDSPGSTSDPRKVVRELWSAVLAKLLAHACGGCGRGVRPTGAEARAVIGLAFPL